MSNDCEPASNCINSVNVDGSAAQIENAGPPIHPSRLAMLQHEPESDDHCDEKDLSPPLQLELGQCYLSDSSAGSKHELNATNRRGTNENINQVIIMPSWSSMADYIFQHPRRPDVKRSVES